MARYDAFGTTLGQGTCQVETAIVVGTIVNPGNVTVTLTKAGMTDSGVAQNVAVLAADTADTVATKIATYLNGVANFTAKCKFEASGPNVIVTALLATANDATMNLAYANGTCTGLTNDATSDNTVTGEAYVNIAQVTNISGPGLQLDTEDVTTHDSTNAFEEVVATILRSGEMSLDIVYDPVNDTHDKAGSLGLVYRMDAKKLSAYKMTFPDAGGTIWYFNGYVTGFEPGAAVDGALTAAVTLKLHGAPTLA